jgi:hypothetical protein
MPDQVAVQSPTRRPAAPWGSRRQECFLGDHCQVGRERVSRHVQETLAARNNLAVAYEAAGGTWAGPSPLCQADDMRKYVIMGIQGSGTGTQAKMLAADLDLVHISVGDIFRWNVQHHTKMGRR